MNEPITVRELSDSTVSDWLAVPRIVYRNDPHFVPRLDLLERQRISPGKNPFFKDGDASFFIAYKEGKPVGRISAQIDLRYLARYRDATGHFGFYDVPDDADVSRQLLAASARWLSSRAMRRMTGPFSLNINEESGLLVKGYDMPASVAMPHAAPWQPGMLERAGFQGIRDLLGFRCKPGDLPQDAFKKLRIVASKAKTNTRITVRDLNKQDFDNEIRAIVDIFNDGLQDSWGFVSLTQQELKAAIGGFKPLLRKNYVKFVCIDGKPQGFIFWTPNLSELTTSFDGKLMPFNWVPLLYAAVFEKFRSARMPLLGIRTSQHGRWTSFVLLSVLFVSWLDDLARYDLAWMEFAWIVETNKIIADVLREALGDPVRLYRIYEAPVDALLG